MGYKFLGQTLKKQPIDFQRVYPVIAYNWTTYHFVIDCYKTQIPYLVSFSPTTPRHQGASILLAIGFILGFG